MFVDLLVIWCVCAAIGYMILNPYNRGTVGCLAGLLLGPIGVVAALIERSNMKLAAERSASLAMEQNTRECPFCAELIQRRAKVCKYCGRDVEPLLT